MDPLTTEPPRLATGLWFARITAVAGSLLLFAASPAPARDAGEPQLFSQSAKAVLERKFPSPAISYLLMDASGAVLAERWISPANPGPPDPAVADPAQLAISPGSLVKPFLAIAYGEQHGGRFPMVRCLGTRSRCWLPSGHGTLGLEEAIAQSCNAYFLELAAKVDRGRAAQAFAHYGLAGPAPEASTESLVGLGAAWKEPPLALARAYLQLEKEQQSPTQSRILSGMLASAARGTARGVDAALGHDAALAKTGTAVCSHRPRGAADGFTVVLYPAAQPRLLLLVRVHGITGAQSAAVAGAMLRCLGGSEQ